jgi:hypothetical protein
MDEKSVKTMLSSRGLSPVYRVVGHSFAKAHQQIVVVVVVAIILVFSVCSTILNLETCYDSQNTLSKHAKDKTTLGYRSR